MPRHDFPSRKRNPKRIELAGDFAGFWYTLNFRLVDLTRFQHEQARIERAGSDPEEIARINEQANRLLLDSWITDHNFVDPNDEPYPIGTGLYEAIDGDLFAEVMRVFQNRGQAQADDPNASSATSGSTSAATVP